MQQICDCEIDVTAYSELQACLVAAPKKRLVIRVAGFIGRNMLETLLTPDERAGASITTGLPWYVNKVVSG
jgi:hypothetical protein